MLSWKRGGRKSEQSRTTVVTRKKPLSAGNTGCERMSTQPTFPGRTVTSPPRGLCCGHNPEQQAPCSPVLPTVSCLLASFLSNSLLHFHPDTLSPSLLSPSFCLCQSDTCLSRADHCIVTSRKCISKP